tara:strand:+ start:2722 stop:3531 length:810 start_codon:yes stop_codon:yes gene_type:complete
MIKYLDLRKQNYLDRKKIGGHQQTIFDIDTWSKNPYSCFKARIYIELSSLFAFILQFTKLTPNHISLIYCFCGILAGAFLISNNNTLMIVGLIIFVLKGSIDWTDGLIARMKNITSSVGHILDTWGSHIGSISFITSIGVYCYNNSNDNIYLFLTIIILFVRFIDFKFYAYYQLFSESLEEKEKINKIIYKADENLQKKGGLLRLFIKNFMDDRSRTVDTVCFLIFLEIIYDKDYLSKIIFGLYFFKTIIYFLGIFYLYYFKKRLEDQI